MAGTRGGLGRIVAMAIALAVGLLVLAVDAAEASAASSAGETRLFARLSAGGERGRAVAIPFGTRAAVSGRLLDGTGAPVAGQRLRIAARPSGGSLVPTTRGTVTTGRGGGFRLPLEPGPSRRVTVYFAGGGGLGTARRGGLALRVRSGAALHARPTRLRTGQAVWLSGRVRSWDARIPGRGKLVAVEYLDAAARRWRPIFIVHTDYGGRFHAHYRFRYVDLAASIRLRAKVLAEERWPYAPGWSRPVTVDVRG